MPGDKLWSKKGTAEGWRKEVNVDRLMSRHRFNQLKKWIPFLWARDDLKNTDKWWQVVQLFDDFNANRRSHLQSSNVKTDDETISAFRPQTEKTGNLPHLLYIMRKPENLGTEFKTVACSILKVMLALELQQGIDDPNNRKYVTEANGKKAAACTVRLAEQSCQRNVPCKEGATNEDSTDDVHVADSWFGSVTTALCFRSLLKSPKKCIMNIKTATSGYPKEYLEEKMKNWPGGSHLVLETTIDGTKLFAIGYKYSARKVMCFIFNEGAASTEEGTPYRARWVDENGNSMVREVPRPHVCAIYFGLSNVIDVLNQQRQKELRLEKHWVTRDGYFRIITSVFGINVVDCWRGYMHHLPNRHRHKNIQLIDFVNMLAYDCTYNNLSDDVEDAGAELTIMDKNTNTPDPPSVLRCSESFSNISQITDMPSQSSVSIERTTRSQDEICKLILSHESTTSTTTIVCADKRKKRKVTRKLRYRCSMRCGENIRTVHYCAKCPPLRKGKHFWICHPDSGRDCWEKHLASL